MGTLELPGVSARKAVLGLLVAKAYTPIAVETKTLFTVTGLNLITAIFGVVTTSMAGIACFALDYNSGGTQ